MVKLQPSDPVLKLQPSDPVLKLQPSDPVLKIDETFYKQAESMWGIHQEGDLPQLSRE